MNNSKQYALDHGLSWAVLNNEKLRVRKFLSKGANALAPCYADTSPVDRAPNIISYAIKDSNHRMVKMLFKSLDNVDCDALFKYAVDHIPHSLYIRALPRKRRVQAYKVCKPDTLNNYKHLAFKHLGICSYILLKAQNLTKDDIEYPNGKPPATLNNAKPPATLNVNPDGTIGDSEDVDIVNVDPVSTITASTTTVSPTTASTTTVNTTIASAKSKALVEDSESSEDSESKESKEDETETKIEDSEPVPIGSDIEGEVYYEVMEISSKKSNAVRNITVIENGRHMYTYMKLSAILGHVLCFKILPSGGYHNCNWNQRVLECAIIRSRMKVIHYLVVDMQLLNNISNYKRILKLALRLKSNDVLNLCLENRKD